MYVAPLLFSLTPQCPPTFLFLESPLQLPFCTKQIMAVRTRAAFKLSLFPDNDLSYSIPHRVKCCTEAVNNLPWSIETWKMLKFILSKLKSIKISESVIPHQTLLRHQFDYVYRLKWKALHTKRDKRHFHFWNITYTKFKKKSMGEMAYYIPTV